MGAVTLSDLIPDVEIMALKAGSYNLFPGNSLRDINLRKFHGLTVVAVKRQGKIIENPRASFVFETEDIIYILGKPAIIAELTYAENKSAELLHPVE